MQHKYMTNFKDRPCILISSELFIFGYTIKTKFVAGNSFCGRGLQRAQVFVGRLLTSFDHVYLRVGFPFTNM